MAADTQGDDPSMEDILASIRRILNEEKPEGEEAAPDGGELLLDQTMLVDAPPAPEVMPPAEPPLVIPAEPRLGIPAEPTPPEELAEPVSLLDPMAARAAAATVTGLLRAIADDRGALVGRAGVTIEDVVRETLRPMLKAWLDEHLPPLVERVVREELGHVLRRAGV